MVQKPPLVTNPARAVSVIYGEVLVFSKGPNQLRPKLSLARVRVEMAEPSEGVQNWILKIWSKRCGMCQNGKETFC